MCEFVSWIEHDDQIYYLNDNCLRDKKGRELKKYLGNRYKYDVRGHGAIRYYYDIKNNTGIDKEYTGNDRDQYPKEIIEDIKNCNMQIIGFNLNLLSKSAWKKYKDIKQPAWKKYKDIEQPALKKYEDIKQNIFWELFKDKKNRIKGWK